MFESFEEFLTMSRTQIPVIWFIVNLLLTGVLAVIVSQIYVRYGTSLSNRRLFARNFMLISMTTMLIITIVKSSLALSLGLVGALSIVRFRAAIKEPEELAYLFICIAIGLGFGANQGVITIISLFVIGIFLVFRQKRKQGYSEGQNIYLTISSKPTTKISIDKLVELLSLHCLKVNLKRFDETNKLLEVNFMVELASFEQLNNIKNTLRELDESMRISFIDQQMVI